MALRSFNSCCGCLLAIAVCVVAVSVRYLYLYEDVTLERYRFGSFAPVRNGSGQAKWFVDGQDYMSAVADAIVSADHEIFIMDWQMSPHIFMKRPDTGITSSEWRLDKMLLRKADDGVRVYILLYWETNLSVELGSGIVGLEFDLGSGIVGSVLDHDNIEVHRHPTFTTPVTYPETMLRWTHHEKVVIVDRKIAFVGGIDLCFGRWDTPSHSLNDNYPLHPSVLGKQECEQAPSSEEPATKYRRWPGKDYGNTLLGVVRTRLDEPFEDYINREEDPRMPWHDVACSFSGDPVLDIARHFIERYNAINHCSWFKLWNRCQLSIDNWDHPETHDDDGDTISDPSSSNIDIQALRSVGNWSSKQPREDSIHQAYIHAIKNAEHFIYIENQYFISSQSKEPDGRVHNEIQQALCDRISRAYANGEKFHVIVMLPLQPEFPDKWGTGGPKDSVSYWNYATLFNGKDSLYEKLKERVPEKHMHRFFSVYSLRTHDFVGGRFVTEIIYVHSKLMIVDDRVTIIGSANINDRSMYGDRDSEVGVMIQDRDMVEGRMNGGPYSVGKFSHGLRCHLMKEHLGLLKEERVERVDLDVEDPLLGDFYLTLHEIAVNNTEIYEMVFYKKIIPTNVNPYVSWTFEDMEEWENVKSFPEIYPEKVEEKLSKVQGSLVLFPPLHKLLTLEPSTWDKNFNFFVDNRDFGDRLVYV